MAGVAFGLLLLLIVAFLSFDYIAKKILEGRIERATGFRTSVGNLNIGFKNATVEMTDLVLRNPRGFDDQTFLEMPDLHIEYDRDALRSGKIHLKIVRINLRKVHLVENQGGVSNVDALQKQPKSAARSIPTTAQTNQISPGFVFDGIDRMDVSLGSIEFTSQRTPEKNLRQDFAVTNEVFNNLKTDLDFQTAGVVLILKAGLSGALDLDTLFQTGSRAGKKNKKPARDASKPSGLVRTNSPNTR